MCKFSLVVRCRKLVINANSQKQSFPDALIKFFEYVNSLKPKEQVNYTKCRQILESYLKSEGKTKASKLEFKNTKKRKAKNDTTEDTDEVDGEIEEVEKKDTKKKKVVKKAVSRTKKVEKPVESETEDCENEEPVEKPRAKKAVKRPVKRKSLEPSLVIKVKKTKMTPKATPPAKKNHTNIATQTSVERPKRSPRQVSFDSPICEIIGSKKPFSAAKDNKSDTSGDIFDDSFTLEGKKTKPKKRLCSDEEISVTRVVKKMTMRRGRSWKDTPAVVNGRSPPK